MREVDPGGAIQHQDRLVLAPSRLSNLVLPARALRVFGVRALGVHRWTANRLLVRPSIAALLLGCLSGSGALDSFLGTAMVQRNRRALVAEISRTAHVVDRDL